MADKVNKAGELRKLIFADFQDQFVSPQVKKGDFVLYYLSKIEEEKVKLNRKLLDQKAKNRVLLAAVRALIKHWKRPEDKAEELKLFKDVQQLVSDYEGMRNLGQILSDSTKIALEKAKWNTLLELEEVKPRKRNCEVNFQK